MAALDPPLQMWPIDASNPQSVIGSDWLRWFLRLYTQINTQPQQMGSTVTQSQQTGAITDKTLTIPQLANGAARINWYLEKTITDGSGSSLQVEVGWTHNAKNLTRTFVALTDDTIYANASASIPIVVDQASPITYSITYASGSGAMQYTFSIWVNQP